MCSAIFSTGCSSANDSRPSPSSPALTALFSVAAACQHGGCGSWNGLGVCIRSGNDEVLALPREPSRSPTSRTTISIGLVPVVTRTVVGSARRRRSAPSASTARSPTRPGRGDSTSTVATFSATRAGWMNPNGISVTPKPSLICSVLSARPPSIASEHGDAERPSRKWCSTHPDRVEPELVGVLDLGDRLVVGALLGLALAVRVGLGPRLDLRLELVQQVELHGSPLVTARLLQCGKSFRIVVDAYVTPRARRHPRRRGPQLPGRQPDARGSRCRTSPRASASTSPPRTRCLGVLADAGYVVRHPRLRTFTPRPRGRRARQRARSSAIPRSTSRATPPATSPARPASRSPSPRSPGDHIVFLARAGEPSARGVPVARRPARPVRAPDRLGLRGLGRRRAVARARGTTRQQLRDVLDGVRRRGYSRRARSRRPQGSRATRSTTSRTPRRRPAPGTPSTGSSATSAGASTRCASSTRRAPYEVSMIAAPVFGPDGDVVLALHAARLRRGAPRHRGRRVRRAAARRRPRRHQAEPGPRAGEDRVTAAPRAGSRATAARAR